MFCPSILAFSPAIFLFSGRILPCLSLGKEIFEMHNSDMHAQAHSHKEHGQNNHIPVAFPLSGIQNLQ
jgi:hypothetical protein